MSAQIVKHSFLFFWCFRCVWFFHIPCLRNRFWAGGWPLRKRMPKTIKGRFFTKTSLKEPRRTSRINVFFGGLPHAEFRGHVLLILQTCQICPCSETHDRCWLCCTCSNCTHHPRRCSLAELRAARMDKNTFGNAEGSVRMCLVSNHGINNSWKSCAFSWFWGGGSRPSRG